MRYKAWFLIILLSCSVFFMPFWEVQGAEKEKLIEIPITNKFQPIIKGGLTAAEIEKNKEAGVIMLDTPVHPQSVEETRLLLERQPQTHTGWSAETYTCKRELTHYEQGKSPVTGKPAFDEYGKPVMMPRYASVWSVDEPWHFTNHKNDVVKLPDKRYTKQLKEKYGHLEKEYGIDFATVEGELRGTGTYWSVYNKYTKNGPTDGNRSPGGDCETGARAYWYNDNEILMTGFILVPASQKVPNLSEGAMKGEAYWELRRDDRNEDSNVHIYSKFEKAGKHYASKTPQHKVKFNGQTYTKKGNKQEIKAQAPGMEVKGSELEYEFSYEYTNYTERVCSGSGEERECWKQADWSRGETFKIVDKIKIDSKQHDTITVPTLEHTEKYIVGRQDTWSPKKRSTPYYEQVTRSKDNPHKSSYDLVSQSTLPITPGALQYDVSLPSQAHEKKDFQPLRHELTSGHMYPADVDDSLKEEYRNKTDWQRGDYAYPIQQHVVTDKGLTNAKQRRFAWDYVTDAFFISRHTGHLVGVPYAEQVKRSLMSQGAAPNKATVFTNGATKLQTTFEKTFNTKYIDDSLYQDAEKDFAKVQRYYLPISPDSTLHPHHLYENNTIIQHVGLNDMTFDYKTSFVFRHYLFGSGADEAFYIEQRDSRVPVKEGQAYHATIKYEDIAKLQALKASREPIPRVHKLRIADRDFIEKVKAIIDIGL